MTEGLATWWRERTVREQRLLTAMFALLALLLVWLLIVRPLSAALDQAKRDHEAAVAAVAQARSRAGAAGRMRNEPAAARAPLPIDGFLSRTASEAGFANARIAAQGPAAATIAIDAARPQAFFAWVRLMERSGLVVETLRARANGDRTVAVEAGFRARSG